MLVAEIKIPARSTAPLEHGSSLIEVLVSLLIIGIGMLGVASLQVYSLSSVKVANVHAQASTLTENLAERMRSNPVGIAAGDFLEITIDTSDTAPDAPTNLCRSSDDLCTAAEFTAADLWHWEMMARLLLPSGTEISVDCNGGAGSCNADGTYLISMAWEEDSRSGVESSGYTTVVQP